MDNDYGCKPKSIIIIFTGNLSEKMGKANIMCIHSDSINILYKFGIGYGPLPLCCSI